MRKETVLKNLALKLIGPLARKGSHNGSSQKLTQLRALFEEYKLIDVALAIGVSELFPPNVASSVKHSFAWMALLGICPSSKNMRTISTYAEFEEFIAKLYGIWPDYPMLEDYCPEPDWGQVKTELGEEFVPMFYGSCIERTPDIVKAFRITNASNDKSLAYMDLAIAIQSNLISSIPELSNEPLPNVDAGAVQVPPKTFWTKCQSAFLNVGIEISKWRAKTDNNLEVQFGQYAGYTSEFEFGNAFMEGKAIPFIAVVEEGYWIPISVRNLPSVVIDYCSNTAPITMNSDIHNKLAEFVSERFSQTYSKPMSVIMDSEVGSKLSVSCVIPEKTGLYLICACDFATYKKVNEAANQVYSTLRLGQPIFFLQNDKEIVQFNRNGGQLPSYEDVKIVIVITQSGTTFNTFSMPKPPTKVLPLADFITIFDEVDKLNELEKFWEYSVSQQGLLCGFSGEADLFASFKDSNEVLIEGATTPTMLVLDTQWGTSRRYKEQSSFWSIAPLYFPKYKTAWRVSSSTKGVTQLAARSQPVCVYSTQLENCTVQTLFTIEPDMGPEDGRVIELYTQMLADCFQRNKHIVDKLPIFRKRHLIIECTVDEKNRIDANSDPQLQKSDSAIVLSVGKSEKRPNTIVFSINTSAVLAGLLNAKDASFENKCLEDALRGCCNVFKKQLPTDFKEQLDVSSSNLARFHIQVVEREVDVPDFSAPLIPSEADYKRARKQLAVSMRQLDLAPGKYELKEAKIKIDAGRDRLRNYIEQRLTAVDKRHLVKRCIEEHDKLLAAERVKLMRLRQSLSHEVEYDQLETAEEIRSELGTTALHYRYLLEKALTINSTGYEVVTDDVLCELVSLVNWYRVMTDASDVLHNEVDVGGIDIDDSFVPEVFYSADSNDRNSEFARIYAKHRLGIDTVVDDEVQGNLNTLLDNSKLRSAFFKDLGFELHNLLATLKILSQSQRAGLGEELSSSYTATPNQIIKVVTDVLEEIAVDEARKIVQFLTLSGRGILRLSGKEIDESEVPYWEHTKRIHRYAIRPLVKEGNRLRWGAETTSRALNIWSSSVKDGYLPADLNLPAIKPVIRTIKKSIETRLEKKAEDIFKRHTPYVIGGIDFKRRFKVEDFDDVGDFDVFAYWPVTNTIVTVECKYNQPPFCIKDSRRLRDKIFGENVTDKRSQYSKIVRRQAFVQQHRDILIELLDWPKPHTEEPNVRDMYVSRDVYYWMVHPPYPIKTTFTRIDTLDSWLKDSL